MGSRGVMSYFQQDASPVPQFALPEVSNQTAAISVSVDPQRPLLVRQVSAEDASTFRQKMVIPFSPLNTIENKFFRSEITVQNGNREVDSPIDVQEEQDLASPDIPLSPASAASDQVLPPFLHRLLELDFPLFKTAQRIRDQFNEEVAKYSRKEEVGKKFHGFWPKLNNLETSAVRGLSWHSHETTLAFADGKDNVVVTSCVASLCANLAEETSFSVTLKHAQQVDIVGLFWDYFSKRTLGVVCLKAVIVWSLEGRSLTSLEVPQLIVNMDAAVDIFTSAVFTSRLTILISSFHGRLREFDRYGADTERKLDYDRILELRLSPDGKLVAYFASNGFLGVFREGSLDSILHCDVGCTVSSFAFLPDSSIIVFSKRSSMQLFSLPIPSPDAVFPNFCFPSVISNFAPAADDSNDVETSKPFWEISGLTLNDAGSHLVLGMTDQNGSIESRCLMCIVSSDASGQPTVKKISGWILCGETDLPFAVDFVHQKNDGDLLTIATKGGRISHLPVFPVVTTDFSSHSVIRAPPGPQLSSGNMLFLFICHVFLPVFHWIASFLPNAQERHLNGFSADISNMSFPTIATPYRVSRVTSFVESKAENPAKDRLYEDILSRGMTSVGEAFPADPSRGTCQQSRDRSPMSDHHMSVDRTPEVPSPRLWKSAFSPLAQQLGNIGLKSSGRNSSPPASPLQRTNSVGKGSPQSIHVSPKLVFDT